MEEDEALNFELQRYLSATEAIARLLEIPLRVSSHGVTVITIHLPGEESVPIGDGGDFDEDAAACGEHTSDSEHESRPQQRFWQGHRSQPQIKPYVSMLTRYFVRPSVPINRPGLDKNHMDDLTIREYFALMPSRLTGGSRLA